MGYTTDHGQSTNRTSVKEQKIVIRRQQIKQWLEALYPQQELALEQLPGDASNRRYFRLQADGRTQLLVDVPPEEGSCQQFIHVSKQLAVQQIRVPRIFAQDVQQGLMLVEDFGDQLLLSCLTETTADNYYRQAMQVLRQLQRIEISLPSYDQPLLQRELNLYREWYLRQQVGLILTSVQEQQLAGLFAILIKRILEQPTVVVHRDYHSRNLMVIDSAELGVIDFQDAVQGPITYDLVSLLKDCYIAWPFSKVEAWAKEFWEQGHTSLTWEQFKDAFHWMGIQRHLKAIGIFARLNLHYGKPGYLKDIPRTMNYVQQAIRLFPELAPLAEFLIPMESSPCPRL